MGTTRTTALALAVVLLVAPAASAATLFQDDFSGAGGPLNGTTPDVTIGAEVWETGNTWLDNGTAGTPVAGSPTGQAAHLDFTPSSGQIYTAEATILNTQANWVGFGFLPDNPSSGDWTQTAANVRHSNAPGYAWVLSRNAPVNNDQEGFLGPNTGGARPWNGDVVDPTSPIRVKIVLNTTAANWTAEWFLNGNSQGAPVAFAAAGNPGIGGIGFSHDRSTTANNGGTISSFSLTVVPEPGTAAMMLIALAGRAIAGRKQR